MRLLEKIIRNKVLNGENISDIMDKVEAKVYEDSDRIRELEDILLDEILVNGDFFCTDVELKEEYMELIDKQNCWKNTLEEIIREHNLIKTSSGWVEDQINLLNNR